MTSRSLILTLAVLLLVAPVRRVAAQTTSQPEARHDISPALSSIPAPPALETAA